MDTKTHNNILDTLLKQVSTSSLRFEVRNDLYKMIQSCKNLITDLDKESVECRRLKRETIKHKELDKKITERIKEIEKMVTLGVLMS